MNDERAGKKTKWFSAVKKVFKHGRKHAKAEATTEEEWFVTHAPTDCYSTNLEVAPVNCSPPSASLPEEVKIVDNFHGADDDNTLPAVSSPVALPCLPPIEDYRSALPVSMAKKYEGKSQEEVAAIKIQTAYRGHQSRRALRALRGLVRLKLLMEGQSVKRQASHTLKCMQTLSRVQSQITYRRIRMSEEKQALQRQLLQKHAKELESLRLDEIWDDSLQSKERIEANLLGKYEAAMRRERALAYSFSHQQSWKNSPRSTSPMFMNPNNPSWGWTWLERWMAAHPWENKNVVEKESANDHTSVKSSNRGIIESFTLHQKSAEKLSSRDSGNPNQTTTITPPTPKHGSFVSRKGKTAYPVSAVGPDDDAKSTVSVQSVKSRRRSAGGLPAAGDENIGNATLLPSYMVPTESAMAKSKPGGSPLVEGAITPEKVSPAKKRLSHPPSPGKLKTRPGATKLENVTNAVEVITDGAVQPSSVL